MVNKPSSIIITNHLFVPLNIHPSLGDDEATLPTPSHYRGPPKITGRAVQALYGSSGPSDQVITYMFFQEAGIMYSGRERAVGLGVF